MATTINKYSVGLTLDASEYIDKSKLSANETRRLRREIEQSRDPMEKHQIAVKRLDDALAKGAISQDVHNRLVARHNEELKRATQSAKKHEVGLAGIGSQLKILAAGYLGLSTLTKAVRMAADADSAAAQFEVLTGSIGNASLLLGDLRRFSDTSPLSFTGAQTAAKTLLSFNVPLQDVMDTLRMLNDITGGNEERFKMLSLSFAQMSAAGRLMGQDLLQMINAGFNPLQQISQRTGESLVELKARMEDGAVSSQEVRQAFIDATSAGGKFAGMADRIAETTSGKLAIANANLEKSYIALGKAIEPVTLALTQGFNEGTSAVQGLTGAVETLSTGIAFTLTLGKDLANSFGIIAAFRGQKSLGDVVEAYKFENIFKGTGDFLDQLKQREIEQKKLADAQKKQKEFNLEAAGIAKEANAAAIQGQDGAASTQASVDQATESYQEQLEKLQKINAELVYGEERVKAIEKAKSRAGMSASERKTLELLEKQNEALEKRKRLNDSLEKKRVKDVAENEKRLSDLKAKFEQTFTSDVQASLASAKKYFEDEKKRIDKIRKDIESGTGGDFVVGSGDDQKFFADQLNRQLAAATFVPGEQQPNNQQMLERAKLEFEEIQKTREASETQNKKLDLLLDEFKQNGFRRIR